MRKSNREVRSPDEIRDIVERCDVCRVGLAGAGAPYIVPMNFGFEFAGGSGADGGTAAGSEAADPATLQLGNRKLTLWFHCATEGRKLDLIADGCEAGFEMDTDHELQSGDSACDYSMNYASVIGSGRLSKVTDDGERLRGLKAVMAHYGGEGRPFNEAYLPVTCVLRLDVEEYACKRLNE